MYSKIVFIMLISILTLSAHGPEGETVDVCGTAVGSTEYLTFNGLVFYLLLILIGIALIAYGYKFSSSVKWRKDIIALGIILIASVLVSYFLGPSFNYDALFFGKVGSQHIHADLRIVLDGQPLNLSQEKYMTTSYNVKSSYVHLHNYHGNIIHVHATGVTLGYFLKTIGLELGDTCFKTDEGQLYCNNGTKSLVTYINGKQQAKPENYILNDLDRILIYYGEPGKIQEEIALVTNESCIQSRNCIPPVDIEPEEECVA